jgi:signal transduction histidine kinase
MGNYEMIDIILRNFISNAIKFTAEGGSVIVSATRDKDLYKLSVLDNGKGFPESQLQKLFVSSVESTPGTRHEKGAGIGLSIAKEFVEMMNGRIGFNSQLNNGTEFYIYLPAVDYHEDHDIL